MFYMFTDLKGHDEENRVLLNSRSTNNVHDSHETGTGRVIM